MNRLIISFLLSIIGASAFAQFGPGPRASGTTLDSIVVVVENDIITQRELNQALTQTEQQIRRSGTKVPSQEVLQQQVLERLISDLLQQQEAERQGIVVDDQTLNAAIDTIAQRNNISLSQLQQQVERDGGSFARFRENIRRQVMIDRLRQRVVGGKVQVSEGEIDAWLASQGSRLEYHLAQILIGVPDAATPSDIENAREKAQQVLADLQQGADFERLAVAVSNAREALEGGDLGWRAANQIPGPFSSVILRLQPGQISDLVRSPQGFHILKLLGTRSGQKNSRLAAAADPRQVARQAVFVRKAEEEWELWLRRLQDESYIEFR